MSGARLGALLDEAPPDLADLLVDDVAVDSRAVTPGSLFVAVPGTRVDGMRFVPAAVAAGARAVAGEAERPADLPGEVAWVRVADARAALAQAAARMHPKQPGTIVAVTGTAGKSSVADFVRQIEAARGASSASLGTLGIVTASGASYGGLTTPDPVVLHKTLERLAADGITHLAMEASSHGLDQKRLDGVRLAAAAFTNLGRDHLDYHPTMEAYFEAKMRLFRALLPAERPAVINLDGDWSQRALAVARETGREVLTTGRRGETLRLVSAARTGFSQRLAIAHAGGTTEIDFPLIGGFQIENALVAAGLAVAAGAGPEEALAPLSGLVGVPGRLERVGEANGALCVVDYAHKPDALANVLATLRPFAMGRLVVVVGCGGDRDPGKRPIMGRVAVEGADVAIVTDDNPRSEDPAAIRAAMLAAAPGAREIGDRAEAIRAGVALLEPGDVLVVAGKGHETGQIVGDRTLPFSDHAEVRAAIEARMR
ncbi:UDP-N-acetylmuramoyl-L-alanyl-D-glutamate--2,6-diaminopimelate ligase [Salinarimonas rosea]|uniref:UDP-N-acetylmuramoyl-L-alanyl-D-glutamate--2, 6-diaminopimelate ligase n=1 Tax=Salinarimonas rosea TaxID=552063 RepID=UPI000414C660|nr:UDP-N-acetylmuramoyl-L-alanyl-D-glutamate--2,6-diaminopimelate ligase [Salinarimonas rosea]